MQILYNNKYGDTKGLKNIDTFLQHLKKLN